MKVVTYFSIQLQLHKKKKGKGEVHNDINHAGLHHLEAINKKNIMNVKNSRDEK